MEKRLSAQYMNMGSVYVNCDVAQIGGGALRINGIPATEDWQ